MDGPATTVATLAQPSGLTGDAEFVYWVDPESSSVRRLTLGNGMVETLVGRGLFEFGFQDGGSTSALLQHPQGLVLHDGILYIADTYNHRVRTVDVQTREVGTLASGERG